ncbi:MAG: hypothetical protein ACKVQR_23295 [Aquabacterium sp.]
MGLRGMVSEDSVRRALAAMVPVASEPWMRGALMSSVREALDRPWVLDMDATIKPLYGRQEGAEVGKQHTSGHAKAAMARLLERLFRREDWTRTTEASQGWQAIEEELRLSG